ncbi:unnamed protein product, partial [Sphagnum tenellum]
ARLETMSKSHESLIHQMEATLQQITAMQQKMDVVLCENQVLEQEKLQLKNLLTCFFLLVKKQKPPPLNIGSSTPTSSLQQPTSAQQQQPQQTQHQTSSESGTGKEQQQQTQSDTASVSSASTTTTTVNTTTAKQRPQNLDDLIRNIQSLDITDTEKKRLEDFLKSREDM